MKHKSVRVGIIMAGGSGERFWPFSRQKRPKQLLKLTNETHTMLEEAVSYIAPVIDPRHLYVITSQTLLDPIRTAKCSIPADNILAEPCKRNTCGCLAYAAAHCLAKYGGSGANITMAVLTADHTIGNPVRFQQTVEIALQAAEQEKALVTLGITPARPETGYGYIEAEKPVLSKENHDDIPVFPLASFHEKPTTEKAREYIAAGNFYWNSGMFFWRLDVFLEEMHLVRPDISQAIRSMTKALKKQDMPAFQTTFSALENISIDYALFEKTHNALVVEADFPWDDVGVWSSIDRVRKGDKAGNITLGDPLLLDSKNCIVYNEPGAKKMAVSVVGMKDIVVAVTKDGVLVIPKKQAQDVRRVVDALKKRNAKQL